MGKLTVRSRALHNDVEISITDAGAGINPTAQEKIFDPFFTTKAFGKGPDRASPSAVSLLKHGCRLMLSNLGSSSSHA
jgi:signal transduction histidine kinase